MGDNVTAQKPAIDANAIAETALQRAAGAQGQQVQQQPQQQQGSGPQPQFRTYDDTGRRYAIRESRIKDRVGYHDANKSAIKVKIELDLEVEVDLYARVKGDVTIGLM